MGKKIEEFDMIQILQFLFPIPALIISIFLFLKFRHAFSIHTQHNIFRICCLMLSQNILVGILRLFVGLKIMFVDMASRENFFAPTILATLWIIIGVIAYRKNGEYGAPWGLLYMQQEEERDKLNQKFMKELAKEKRYMANFDQIS